jgi:diaminohydroxyphosphoribosylaminopyrimidine deaminase/5-amino-6-(5-phosphoribosylamino)uracil reductase
VPNPLHTLLDLLGERQMTNLLVEGGGKVLGSFLDAGLINEVHAFVAPMLIGGKGSSPFAGSGVEQIDLADRLERCHVEQIEGDLYVSGRFPREKSV